MTEALLETDHGNWRAHGHVDRYTALDERAVMHTLFPKRAALVDKAKNGGYLHRLPKFLVPHIEGDMYKGFGIDPYGTQDEPGNLLANAGINRLGSLLIAGGGQAYDHTHTAIAIGDTATAATAADTDLGAAVNASNRYVQVADTSYPAFATQVFTCIATFATGNGNLAWAEWGICGNTASGANAATAPLLNHKITSLGTKTSSAAWAFTITITIS